MPTIGITGSSGFIGRHLVSTLQKEPFDDLSLRSFDHSHDICDTVALEEFLRDLDVVVHLAGANREIPTEIVRVNSMGTLSLLESMSRCCRRARCILASSFQVYPPTTQPVPIEEIQAPDPQTLYGVSKRFAEELCRYYKREHRLSIEVFRLSNVYGIGCRPGYNSVVATFVDAALKGETIRMGGDGSSVRDFIAVADVVGALAASIRRRPGGEMEIFNICSGRLISINEVVEAIEAQVGKVRVQRSQTMESRDPAMARREGFLLGSNRKAVEAGIMKLPLKDFKEEIAAIIAHEREKLERVP